MQSAVPASTGPTISVTSQPIERTPEELRLQDAYRENIARGIDLLVVPGMETSWESFCKVVPPHSIALDGIVRGAARFDEHGIRANFNHHQDVNRLATRSTCGQIHMAVKSGLMEAFREGGQVKLHIYVNDPDQDSSLSVWLLKNHERLSGIRSEPLINKLVIAEDFIDAAAGGFPFDPRSSMMQELAWVFDPYVQARMAGRIRSMEGSEMANVITAVGKRIDDYTLGTSERIALDTRYEFIGGGEHWKMIRETGFYARSALFAQGTDAFISFLAEDKGKYHYSIGRRSPFITHFPVEELYAALNHAEGLDMQSGVCWNGGDTIGGSPRRVGSSLPPKELETLINQYLSRRSQPPPSA